jgi:hypothetical protein
MDKCFAAGPLVMLKTVVAFNVDYFGNEKGEVTPKDSPLLESEVCGRKTEKAQTVGIYRSPTLPRKKCVQYGGV